MQVSNGFGGGLIAHQLSFAPGFRGPVADSGALPAAQPPAPSAPAPSVANAGTFFPQSQFSSPFAVFGSPFAPGFGGGYGYGLASPQAAPAQTGAAPAQASAGAGHTVANPTNSLVTNPAAPQGPFGQSGQGGVGALGSFGYAAPSFLVPAIIPAGIPVMFAVGVFAFAPVVQTPAAPAPTPALDPAPAPIVDDAPDVVVPDAPMLDVDVPTPPPVVSEDVTDPPPADEPDSQPPVQVISNPDFERYKESSSEQSLETALVLSLTTADGDEITLDFRQLDVLRSESFEGAKLAGGDALRDDSDTSSDRYVTMNVVGAISDAEQAAIDAVLDSVTAVANEFFGGSYQDAMSTLAAMDFDSSQLSELSLSMTMTRSAVVTNGYREGGERLDQLKNKGGEIVEALEYLATEQRRMIDQAKEVLDDGSAAKLVRGLMPLMLEDTVGKLREQVAAADPVEPAADTSVEGAANEPVAG